MIYLDVDTSGSTPEVQAADYKIMWPIATRDWADLEAAGIDEYPPGKGLFRATWPTIRDDVTPDVNMFHVPEFSVLFVTDALAGRLMAANVRVDFTDMSKKVPDGAPFPTKGTP